MKNKNALNIVLAIGAGVVAYYLFTKKKVKKENLEVPPIDTESEGSTIGSGGGFIGGNIPKPMPKPMPMPTVTDSEQSNILMQTRPLLNVSSSSPSPIRKPIMAISTPIKDDITSISNTISTQSAKPSTPNQVISAPIGLKPTTITAIAQTTPIKSGFEGVGQQQFEVGECLNDL